MHPGAAQGVEERGFADIGHADDHEARAGDGGGGGAAGEEGEDFVGGVGGFVGGEEGGVRVVEVCEGLLALGVVSCGGLHGFERRVEREFGARTNLSATKPSLPRSCFV